MDFKQIEVTSKKFALNAKDFLRGLIIASGTSATFVLEPLINQWMTGEVEEINWKLVIRAGLGAGLVYLGKNLFQESKVKVSATPEQIDVLKQSVTTKEVAK